MQSKIEFFQKFGNSEFGSCFLSRLHLQTKLPGFPVTGLKQKPTMSVFIAARFAQKHSTVHAPQFTRRGTRKVDASCKVNTLCQWPAATTSHSSLLMLFWLLTNQIRARSIQATASSLHSSARQLPGSYFKDAK